MTWKCCCGRFSALLSDDDDDPQSHRVLWQFERHGADECTDGYGRSIAFKWKESLK